MARYIDADELLNRLPDDLPYKASVKRVLTQAPTSDVVPKSEVEKLEAYIDDLNDSKEHLCVMLDEAKAEVAREIFEEIEELISYRRCGGGVLDAALEEDLEILKERYGG